MSRMQGNGTQLATRDESESEIALIEECQVQVLPPSALATITRAEIDSQIATAKAYPRNFGKFVRTAKLMVQSDPELAAQCTYVLPERAKGAGAITGPSVRLAEIVAVCWGNLSVGGRIVDDDGRMLTAQGVAIDLESNVRYTMELKKGVTYSPKAKYNAGARFGDDMVKTTSAALVATVTRNVTFKVVPRAFVNMIQDEADRVARGDIKSIPERASRAIGWFTAKGVPEDKVLSAIGVSTRDEITLDQLQTLNGYKVAVTDGAGSLDEIFSPAKEIPVASAPPGETKAAGLTRKLGGEQPAKEAVKAKPEPKPEREPGQDG